MDPSEDGSFAFCTGILKDSYDLAARCRTNTSALTLALYIEANMLYANNESVTAVLAKLEELTGSRRQRAVASSCAEVITKSTSLVELLTASASDPDIATISQEISCSTVSCTPQEQTELSQVVVSLKEAVQNIGVALPGAINQLEGGNIKDIYLIYLISLELSGTTPSFAFTPPGCPTADPPINQSPTTTTTTTTTMTTSTTIAPQ